MIRRERTFYTKEFRDRALAVYYGSEESAALVAQRFEVNLETLLSWIKRYSNKIPNLDEPKAQVVKKETITQKELEQRIHQLEKALEHERMRAVCLDKMIDIAEQELKVRIRKSLEPNSPRGEIRASKL